MLKGKGILGTVFCVQGMLKGKGILGTVFCVQGLLKGMGKGMLDTISAFRYTERNGKRHA